MELVQQSSARTNSERRAVAHRTKMILAVTVSVRGMSLDARMRDMSNSGALLEGPILPHLGSTVVISRHVHRAAAEVQWVSAGRCGVKFVEAVDITAWTGLKVKQQTPALPAAPIPQDGDLETAIPFRVGEELAYVQRIIESLGDELSSSPIIVQRYATALQKFDLANQLLSHLAQVLMADDRDRAAHQISMESLRKRLLR